MEQLFGKTMPSAIKDPFKAECIETINMRCDKAMFGDGEYNFRGYVEFKNGITEGTQRFEASNLGELYEKIVEFCKSLE